MPLEDFYWFGVLAMGWVSEKTKSYIGTPWVLFMWHPAPSEWDHPRWLWCSWQNMWYIFTVYKSVSSLEQSIFVQLFLSQMTEIQLVVLLVMVDNIFVHVRLYEFIRTIKTGLKELSHYKNYPHQLAWYLSFLGTKWKL